MTALVTAVGTSLATWPLPVRMGSATLRSGEVLLTAWQLNWFQRALLSDPLSWARANIFFPYENAATANDLLLAHAVVSLPAAWFDSPVLALNVAFLGGIVLCAICAHLLLMEVLDAPWAAALGATLFALTPFRFLHLGHLSIAAAWAVPLFFWALLRHFRRPSWSAAATAGVTGVAVGASSLYHAAYVAPILPLVVLFAARRGPGGRRTWIPVTICGAAGLGMLALLLLPYAESVRQFGTASAPGDLIRYGADLSSLAQRPSFLGGRATELGIDPEARLYPGALLALLTAVGSSIAAVVVVRARGWRRVGGTILLALLVLAILGGLVPGDDLASGGFARDAWRWIVLALIWLAPLGVAAWAIVETVAREPRGPLVALRLGLAGSALAFALSLGPQARWFGEPLGAAPYALLAQATPLFAGTRAPARFGGIVVLFLSLVAAGAAAWLSRAWQQRQAARGSADLRSPDPGTPVPDVGTRPILGGLALAALVVAGTFAELPVRNLPEGRRLVATPDLDHAVYDWLAEQPGPFGVLELPSWTEDSDVPFEYRTWRALRYMLASKRHGKHLANGAGRIQPFLWNRFLDTEPWSDEFFRYVVSYFPVRYVVVHEPGIPASMRAAARGGIASAPWVSVFEAEGSRVFTVDRSAENGARIDRLYLRRDLHPVARVRFSARAADRGGSPGAGDGDPVTLELLHEGILVDRWTLGEEWRDFELMVPVRRDRSRSRESWPRAGTLFRWRTGNDLSAPFELAELSVERAAGSPP